MMHSIEQFKLKLYSCRRNQPLGTSSCCCSLSSLISFDLHADKFDTNVFRILVIDHFLEI